MAALRLRSLISSKWVGANRIPNISMYLGVFHHTHACTSMMHPVLVYILSMRHVVQYTQYSSGPLESSASVCLFRVVSSIYLPRRR